MPAVTRLVEVKLPEAEDLADLYGIVYDLDIASHLCRKAIELDKSQERDSWVVDGLISAALIRYCRCFSSGVRLGLSPTDLEALDQEAREAHRAFKALRDKFVAHSVNPFEESFVTAGATMRDGTKHPIKSINPGSHRVLLSTADAEPLIRLISSVKAIVRARIESEESRVLAFLQSLPLELIHSWNPYEPRRFKAKDVYRSRPQRSRLRRK